MEWVNAVVLIGLVFFVVIQNRHVRTLEKDLALQKEKLTLQDGMLATHRDILASQKGVPASAMVYPDIPAPKQPTDETKVTDKAIEKKQREDMAEEKARFEKEVKVKTKSIEWYEKEFSIGLDALLELFFHIPLGVRESIISKMPNSVIKKGFKRLSDKRIGS